MRNFITAAILAAALPAAASAASVDLSGWMENGLRGNNGAGDWEVQGTNNDSVLQKINGTPTVFFDPTGGAQGKALKGTIKVETTGDDDFVGFVLGYSDGEMNSTNADFWLIDWKQGTQNVSGEDTGWAGLALSHVTGNISATTGSYGGFWGHTGVVNEVQRGASLGATGWADLTEYSFDIEFTANLIKVKVNGSTELELSSATYGSLFTNGGFGFYNSSQDKVRYAGITEEQAPSVPLPASLPLLLAGVGGIAALRRKSK